MAAETYPRVDPFAFVRTGNVLAGRFRLDSLARRGGMGAIYRGIDLQTERPVAIKTVGRLATHSRARFAREISILAELPHPAIVQYLAHGTTAEGALFLVMEWLTGEDLAERLRRAPLSVEESSVLLRRACGALSLAHRRGIVHRDIKPANLFLPASDPESVKVLDFGIARLDEGTQSLTTEGMQLGTVGYMSPEQAMGELDVDPRADVFALGCVFYECLTGRAPFASSHPVGILAKVLQEDPPRPSEIRPELGPALDEFVARLLAKNRRDRPRDAAAILQSFDDLDRSATIVFAKLRPSLSPRRQDQKIVSVILGGRQDGHATVVDEGNDADVGLEHWSEKFGARLLPLKGGALLLILGGRGEANDRASRAALCALELSTQRPDLTLAVATGLADTSGSVPVGVAIDRAAALLAANSSAKNVLLDEVTLGLVGLRFEVQRVGEANLLLAARRELDVPRLLMGRATPHVGRDRELRTLDEALSECVHDRVSHAVLVTGPPGIGKTRLASEWLTRGGRGGLVRTLFTRADPISAGSAWSLIRLLIRDAAALREAEPAEAQLTRLGDHLTRLLGAPVSPRTFEFLCEVVGLRQRQPSPVLLAARSNPDVMREQVRRALHEWLDAEAHTQPLLLVLEDLHWGDTPSVAFLAEAMRETPHRAMLVLALARPEVERQFPEFCERAVLRLRLPGLGGRAAQELIDFALEGRVDEETTLRLIRITDGNPFYLEELIRRVAVGSTDWPETVIAMVQSRIDQLDPDARCVLLAASVLGERCWDAAIAEILDGSVNVDAVLDLLDREEILLSVDDSRYAGSREYRFRHALFRDAAYAMLTRRDRCMAHGIAADWLERNREKDARLLADHYEAAEAREKAGPWLMKAAKKAIDAGDLLVTIELANRGIALGAQGVDRARFLMLRSYAEALSGEPNLELTREALELLPVGTPLWWLALGVLVIGAGILGKPADAAPYVVLAARTPFARERDVALGQGLVTLVGGLVLLGKADVAETVLARAGLGEADSAEDPLFGAFLGAAQCALEAVAPVGGRWRLERALREGRRCATALGALGALHGQSVVLCYLAVAAMHLGLYEEARDACIQSSALARRVRSCDGWPFLFLAKAYLRLGQPDEALRAVEPILASTDRIVRQMLPVVIGEARLRSGDPITAEAEVTPAFQGKSPRLQRLAACVLARAQLGQGNAARALDTIETALEAATSTGLESEIDLMNLKAECLLAAGHHVRAQEVASRARALVMGVAADIEDALLRRSFLESVEPCARALSLHEQLS